MNQVIKQSENSCLVLIFFRTGEKYEIRLDDLEMCLDFLNKFEDVNSDIILIQIIRNGDIFISKELIIAKHAIFDKIMFEQGIDITRYQKILQ